MLIWYWQLVLSKPTGSRVFTLESLFYRFYRDRAASFRVGGLKKNAWRKIFLLNYFLFNLFLFLQISGGAKAPPPSPSLCAVPVLSFLTSYFFSLSLFTITSEYKRDARIRGRDWISSVWKLWYLRGGRVPFSIHYQIGQRTFTVHISSSTTYYLKKMELWVYGHAL